jgi:hypothetical protein
MIIKLHIRLPFQDSYIESFLRLLEVEKYT